MIISIFEYMKDCISSDAATIFSKLKEINVSIFNELYIEEGEGEKFSIAEAATITMYLLYAYSQESNWLILGVDTTSERLSIAERVGLPEYQHTPVIALGSPLVRTVMVKYINMQTSRPFKMLSFKKDMYEAAMSQGVLKLTDTNGGIDVKAMAEADKYMGKLLEDIKEYEDQLRSEYAIVYENMEEIKDIEKSIKAKKDTGNVENSEYIS